MKMHLAPEMYLGPSWDRPSKKSKQSRETLDDKDIKSGELMKSMFKKSKFMLWKTRNKIFPLDSVASKSLKSRQGKKPDQDKPGLGKPDQAKPDQDKPGAVKDTDKKKVRVANAEEEKDNTFPRYKNYGKSVDWFAVGITVHQMYCYGLVSQSYIHPCDFDFLQSSRLLGASRNRSVII